MASTLVRTRVMPGHRVEFATPELPEGTSILVLWSQTHSEDDGGLEHRFQALADQWRKEAVLLSSVVEMAMHPAYQQIIGLGSAAIPLILDEMRARPGHWFWALRAISGEDPTHPEHRGNLRAMADAWLGSGRERGYLP
jgi:hypothetical protein